MQIGTHLNKNVSNTNMGNNIITQNGSNGVDVSVEQIIKYEQVQEETNKWRTQFKLLLVSFGFSTNST